MATEYHDLFKYLADTHISTGKQIYQRLAEIDERLITHDGADALIPLASIVSGSGEVPAPVSKITQDLTVDTIDTDSFFARITYDEVCKLRTYVDTNNPPTTLVRLEDSFLYSGHNGEVTGLTADTNYFVQVEAEFQDGSTEKSSVVQASTLAASVGTTLIVPSNVSRGNWTAADWTSYFGGDLVYSESTGHQFIESTTFNGEDAIKFNMVPSSIGSARLSADGRIPETNHLKIEFDVVFLGNPDPNVFDFGGGANSSNGFKVSRQRGKFGAGFGRGEVGGGVNTPDGVRVRGMWDGQNMIDYVYKAGQTSYLDVAHSDGYVIVPNTKIRLTREIKINSGYTTADGYMITTRDGNVVNNMQNVIWMTDGPLTIDRLVVANFYGGNDDTYSAQSEQDVLLMNFSWTDLST